MTDDGNVVETLSENEAEALAALADERMVEA
jgi:hypothetical protein